MADTPNETDNFEVVTSDGPAAPATAPTTEDSGTSPGEPPKGEEAKTDDQPKGEEDGKGGKSAADDAAADTGADRRSGRLQKRIDKLTKRASEAERRAAELEQQLAGKGKPSEEPDPSDYDDYGKYLDDLAAWKEKPKGDPKPKDAPKDEPKPSISEEFAEALEEVQEAFAEASKKYDNFDELIKAPDLRISEDMVIAMADTENPADIAHYLATNKAEAARIAELPPRTQAKEIGKLEAKLSAEPPKPTKKITNAPAPIEPVGGSDASTKDIHEMSFSEYEKKRNEQERNGGKGFW